MRWNPKQEISEAVASESATERVAVVLPRSKVSVGTHPSDIGACLDAMRSLGQGERVIPLERVHSQKPGLLFGQSADDCCAQSNPLGKAGVGLIPGRIRNSQVSGDGRSGILTLLSIDGPAVTEAGFVEKRWGQSAGQTEHNVLESLRNPDASHQV